MVPREPVANVKFRVKLLKAMRDDARLRAGIEEMCKRDILFAINVFVWQFNPDECQARKIGPFTTYGFQDVGIKAIWERWIIKRQDCLVEKSRKLGASWIAIILQVIACTFFKWQKFINVSHTEKAVDETGDAGSLFWKIDFINQHMPSFMLGGVVRKKMMFRYPRTNSTITGTSSSKRTGVGDRGNVLLDELGRQTNAAAIIGQTADTGPRLMISTHYGVGTAFYELCLRPDMYKLVWHWSDHPVFGAGLYRSLGEGKYEIIDTSYQFPFAYPFVTDGSPGGACPGIRSPWYDNECNRRKNKRDIAMHLDIDPAASDVQFFDTVALRTLRLQYCSYPVWEGDILFDRWTGAFQRVIQRPNGKLRLWWHPDLNFRFPEGKYVAGVDTSTGGGATPSCVSVGSVRHSQKIMEYTDPVIEPPALAGLVYHMLKEWLWGAYLVWETNGPGGKFGKRIMEELGYSNIYMEMVDVPAVRAREYTDRPGWRSSAASKRILLEDYKEALHNYTYINPSFFAIDECMKFRYTTTGVEHPGESATDDPSGSRENHGDITMADALCWRGMKLLGAGKAGAAEKIENLPVMSFFWRRAVIDEMDRRRALDLD